jgi:hypothetical protein
VNQVWGEKSEKVNYPITNETIWVSLEIVFGRCSVRIVAGTPAILIEAVRSFPRSLQTNAGVVLRLGHIRFVPNPSQFIFIHVSSYRSTLGYIWPRY